MKIIAAKGRVVLSPIEADSKSKGGIIIPDQAKDKPDKGMVVSSGDEDYKVGATILYPKYAGYSFESDNDKFLILKGEEILAILQ